MAHDVDDDSDRNVARKRVLRMQNGRPVEDRDGDGESGDDATDD